MTSEENIGQMSHIDVFGVSEEEMKKYFLGKCGYKFESINVVTV